jgi:DNA repair protein RadA/Sms
MAKPKSKYVCNHCGSEYAQMYGRCPDCGTWESLQEQVVEVVAAKANHLAKLPGTKQPVGKNFQPKPRKSLTLAQIGDDCQQRLGSGYGELDRVLGVASCRDRWC